MRQRARQKCYENGTRGESGGLHRSVGINKVDHPPPLLYTIPSLTAAPVVRYPFLLCAGAYCMTPLGGHVIGGA